jgi:hypothetical protein
MNNEQTNETVVVQTKKPFVCPTDPAELAQCDSCQ